MGLNINNEETYKLTKQLAKLTGESLTVAITKAARERLDRVRRACGDDIAERLLMIGRDCAAIHHSSASRAATRRRTQPCRKRENSLSAFYSHGA